MRTHHAQVIAGIVVALGAFGLGGTSRAESSLTTGTFHILGSQNTPASFLAPRISVNANHWGYCGTGNVNSVATPVNIYPDEPIIDYRFYNAANQATQSYATKGAGRISELTGDFRSVVNRHWFQVWTVTDPGDDLLSPANGADFTSSTAAHQVYSATGTVDIASMDAGSIYFFYGAWNDTPVFSATMKDTEAIETDITLSPFGNDDVANRQELYVVRIDFVNDAGYDTIEWTFDSSNGAIGGVVLTGLPPTGSSLTAGKFHILGSENTPAAFRTPAISVYADHLAYSGTGNVNNVATPVNESFTDAVVDYRFYKRKSFSEIETYATKGAGRISEIIAEGSFINRNEYRVWTVTDPGDDLSHPASSADYTNATTVHQINDATGTVNIASMDNGSIYFFYGAYNCTPVFRATMKDAESVEPDLSFEFINPDYANLAELYVVPLQFVNVSGYDTIEWTMERSNLGTYATLRICGIVLTEPPPPIGTVILVW